MERLRKDTVYAVDAIKSDLRDRFRKSKERSYDAWQEGQNPVHATQFIPLTPIDEVLA